MKSVGHDQATPRIGHWFLEAGHCPPSCVPRSPLVKRPPIISQLILTFRKLILGLSQDGFALLDRILNRTHIQECLFWQVIHLTVKNHLESRDGIFNIHHHARHTCELLSHSKWLGKEPLHTTGTIHCHLVLV